jgi:uncharacterized membrane protein YbaN (DUF454 family)
LVRPLFFALGLLCVALGALGVVVPGLPTTPFILVALFGFSKSSEQLERWLYDHHIFGPPLQRWRRHRMIAFRHKLVAFAAMAASSTYLVISGAPLEVLTMTGLLMLFGAVVLTRVPHNVRSENGKSLDDHA